MFTGIIEVTGKVVDLVLQEDNLHITISSPIAAELKIDQSVAHNGVCLTVIKFDKYTHTVTAVKETLLKTNLATVKLGDILNLERCVKIGDRLDGHYVQGHVDITGRLIGMNNEQGSYRLTFSYDELYKDLVVDKGSIAINGVSLTLTRVANNQFSVAIIPYTWNNTSIGLIKIDDPVNIEFDVLGKYVQRIMHNKYIQS